MAVNIHGVHKDQEVDWDLQPATIMAEQVGRMWLMLSVSYSKPSRSLASIKWSCVSSHFFRVLSGRQPTVDR